MDSAPPPRDTCGCIQHLKDRAATELAEADRLQRTKRTRPNARMARRRAVALSWAAGTLRKQQEGQ